MSGHWIEIKGKTHEWKEITGRMPEWPKIIVSINNCIYITCR